MKEGKQIEYYENGNIEYEAYFKNNLKNGIESGFFPSGKIESFGIYSNGKQSGKFYEYYESGLIKKESFYEDDLLVSETTYDEQGIKNIN